ncbi:hypothetical protein [Subtercola boreus]|nr:hypothetical protein [Subtercola boreus]
MFFVALAIIATALYGSAVGIGHLGVSLNNDLNHYVTNSVAHIFAQIK